MFVFLFGAPGVGTGTLSRLLQNDLRMLHLSTTGEIRKIIGAETAKGVQVKLINQLRKVILAGGLITDDLIIELICEKAEIKGRRYKLFIKFSSSEQSEACLQACDDLVKCS